MKEKRSLGVTIFAMGYFYISAMFFVFLFDMFFETFAREFGEMLVVTAHSFLLVFQFNGISFLISSAIFLPPSILFFVLGRGMWKMEQWSVKLSFFANILGIIGFPMLSFLSVFDADPRDWHVRVILVHGVLSTIFSIIALIYFSFLNIRRKFERNNFGAGL